MIQIDSLRAIAVSAVFLHHFSGNRFGLAGTLGVQLFFCISGFLITGILIHSRKRIHLKQSSAKQELIRFYSRRALRIFPLYYIVILLCYVSNLGEVRNIIGWLITYTLNIYMSNNGWFEEYYAHLWSLCVEEQFYIFWPFLVIFLRTEHVLPAIILIILIAPMYRLAGLLLPDHISGLSTYISTPASMDMLGTGALLALAVEHINSDKLIRLSFYVFMSGVLAVAALWKGGGGSGVMFNVPVALLLCCILFWASIGVRGHVGRALESRPVLYIGKISYGLYVYHEFVLSLTSTVFPLHPELRGALALFLTFAISSVSYHFFEVRFLKFKQYFGAPETKSSLSLPTKAEIERIS